MLLVNLLEKFIFGGKVSILWMRKSLEEDIVIQGGLYD